MRRRHSPSLGRPDFTLDRPLRPSVYVAKDYHGDVLYVGKSRSLFARLGQHARLSLWYGAVGTIDVFEFDSDREALAAERRAIIELQPPHNEVGLGWHDVP